MESPTRVLKPSTSYGNILLFLFCLVATGTLAYVYLVYLNPSEDANAAPDSSEDADPSMTSPPIKSAMQLPNLEVARAVKAMLAMKQTPEYPPPVSDPAPKPVAPPIAPGNAPQKADAAARRAAGKEDVPPIASGNAYVLQKADAAARRAAGKKDAPPTAPVNAYAQQRTEAAARRAASKKDAPIAPVNAWVVHDD